MYNLILVREESTPKQTLGTLIVMDEDYNTINTVKTLELPYKGNKKNISSIPKGTYQVTKRNSAKYGDHFHIQDVPNRKYILIHQGNYYSQIRGCILVGERYSDINGDDIKDVTNSVKTMNELLQVLPNNFELEII